MSTAALFRLAARTQPHCKLFRPPPRCTSAARRVAPVVTAARGGYGSGNTFSTSVRKSDDSGEENFEEFNARYEKEFENVQDVFELQRNLNNCFAYDLVPSPDVITAALRAARRVNDFPTAVRIFEGTGVPTLCKFIPMVSKGSEPWETHRACFSRNSKPKKDPGKPFVIKMLIRALLLSPAGIKAKVEHQGQYEEYLEDLKPLREELGVSLQEELYPGVQFHG
ncbi:MAG: hypothetical protein Q9216_005559 [Gyalolechia sp. 2 TL-2023]